MKDLMENRGGCLGERWRIVWLNGEQRDGGTGKKTSLDVLCILLPCLFVACAWKSILPYSQKWEYALYFKLRGPSTLKRMKKLHLILHLGAPGEVWRYGGFICSTTSEDASAFKVQTCTICFQLIKFSCDWNFLPNTCVLIIGSLLHNPTCGLLWVNLWSIPIIRIPAVGGIHLSCLWSFCRILHWNSLLTLPHPTSTLKNSLCHLRLSYHSGGAIPASLSLTPLSLPLFSFKS